MTLGLVGLILGLLVAQPAGASVYRLMDPPATGNRLWPLLRALATGLTTAAVATGVFVLFRVHAWLGDYDWRSSAFLGVCFGICQAALLKGHPVLRRPTWLGFRR